MNIDIEKKLEKATRLHRDGNLMKAKSLYEEVLTKDKNNINGLHYLSLLFFQKSEYAEAKKLIMHAININPNVPAMYNTLGNLQELQTQFEDALSSYQKAITLKPNFFQSIIFKADVLCKLKNYDKAIKVYDNALLINPKDVNTIFKLGNTYKLLKKYKNAIECYTNIISLNPKIPEVYNNRGYAYKQLKNNKMALADLDKAIELNSNYHNAYNNLGNLHRENKNFELAILNFKKAISIDPKNSQVYNNLGNVFIDLEKPNEAISYYMNSISIDPNNARSFSNVGHAFSKIKQFDKAITYFKMAFKLNPNDNFLISNYLHTKLNICNWDNLPKLLKKNLGQIKQNDTVNIPFAELSFHDLPEIHKIVSQKFIDQNYPNKIIKRMSITKKLNNKIRVAYISSDFCDHPVSKLCIEIFESHDKSKFEIIGINLGNNKLDSMYERLSNAFDKIINVKHLKDQEIANLCKKLSIDIAIDLNGHTKNNRMGLFSYGAAPIQVNFLGYPGTSGAKYINYIIADKTVLPKRFQKNYTEKIIYLPNSYLPTPSKKIISDKVFSKVDFNLPVNGFIFCCFNNNFKISKEIFISWMNILTKVNDSVLWLSPMNSLAKSNIYKEAKNMGIENNRIIFSERIELHSEHLARLKLADLFLDTYPYNAHSTAIDAISASVPIVTLTGNSFASRVGASLLNALNLPELISYDLDTYEKIAIELATNIKEIKSIKNHLTNNEFAKILFNPKLFTKNIEEAYQAIYKNFLNGKEPQVFEIYK